MKGQKLGKLVGPWKRLWYVACVASSSCRELASGVVLSNVREWAVPKGCRRRTFPLPPAVVEARSVECLGDVELGYEESLPCSSL